LIAYALRRLAALAAVVVLAVALSFVIIGSLFGSIYGHVTVWHQLAKLPGHLVRVFGHLDLGYDQKYRQVASRSLWQGLPVDSALVLGGLVCGIAIGLVVGVIGAPRGRSAVDGGLMLGSSVILSAPVYLLAAVFIDEFAGTTGRLHLGFVSDVGAYTAINRDPLAWLHAMWVPWLIVGAPLEADYVRTARAKGLVERVVMRRHVFRAALPAVLGTVSVTVPTVVVNAILLETAMELPGLFTRFDISPQTGDKFTSPSFTIVQVLVLETTVLVAVGIFICDVLHAWLDPQVRR
jgi:peptide/nickel transport system permease protein